MEGTERGHVEKHQRPSAPGQLTMAGDQGPPLGRARAGPGPWGEPWAASTGAEEPHESLVRRLVLGWGTDPDKGGGWEV